MSLEQTYREIAEALGGSIVGDRYNKTFLRVQGVDTMLDTIDGLMEVWDEYCKGWWWERKVRPSDGTVRYAAGPDPELSHIKMDSVGNFHADFAYLLASVLKEIQGGKKHE